MKKLSTKAQAVLKETLKNAKGDKKAAREVLESWIHRCELAECISLTEIMKEAYGALRERKIKSYGFNN